MTMLKALIRKQFKEIFAAYFQDRKTGKLRSRGKSAAYLLLYAALLVFLGCGCFFLANTLCEALVPLGLSWVYFSMMGIVAAFSGVVGGVFNTYAALYRAKDNDLLLSLPIPTPTLLTAKLLSVYGMGLLYEAIVFVPAIIAYFLHAELRIPNVVLPILTMPVLGFLVLTVICALGWVVAVISSRLKNKSLVTVTLMLVFMAACYYVCLNYYSALMKILQNIDKVSVAIKNAAYPFYMMGRGCDGQVLPFLIFLCMVAALFLVCWLVLSATFLRIATKSDKETRKVYVEKTAKVSSAGKALLRRELKHLFSSPMYLMNSALGTIFMPLAAIAVLIFRSRLSDALGMMTMAGIGGDKPAALLPAAVALIATMNTLTAPSVSLEGKNLWIARSLPVTTLEILNAKQRMCLLLTVPPMVLLYAALSFVMGLDVQLALFGCIVDIVAVALMGAVGLMLNLKKPNLTWTNEMVPVKQSLSVGITLFGGWFVAILIGLGGWFLSDKMGTLRYLTVWLVVLALCYRLLNGWISKKGTALFEQL